VFGRTLSSLTSPCISLESHVQMLQDSNQAIPQPVAMLLAEARRKEEKRTAKRVANRKSACTSRARKKALVEEMTRTNARLKRQAMILALLPDLVIAITIDGEITFCSAQVSCIYYDNMR
jgi:PAS domain-containing protein